MHRIAILTLACAMSWPVRAQPTRMTPDQFRSRFNLALRDRGLTMQLAGWTPDSRGSLALTAVVTRNIRLIAQQDRAERLSSIRSSSGWFPATRTQIDPTHCPCSQVRIRRHT